VALDRSDEVLNAAAVLVAAFARHDVKAYFGAFAPDATFVFYNNDRILNSRAEYEQLWAAWEADGFQVLGCTSLEGVVQMLGDDVGVFHHRVRTTLAGEGGRVETGERETIVFQRRNGVWYCVHEHLSADPSF